MVNDNLFLVGAGVSAFVVAVAVYFIFGGSKRPSNAPPNVHVGIPLLGNFIEFGKNPVAFASNCLAKYGEVYTVPMMHKNLTFLLGPEASTPFFKLPDEDMSQPEVYRFMTPVFGKGVIYDAEPSRRYQQMQQAAQGLRKDRLIAYIPKIEREVATYLNSNWGQKGEGNMLDALSELTIMTATRCLHGDDVRETMFNDVARLFHDLDKGTEPLSFFFPYLPTPAHAKRDRAREEMVEIFTKVIAARRADTTTKPEDRTDLLQLFIDFKYRDKQGLTDDQIVGMLIALLFAGQHTSSVTATWTVMFILHDKRIYDKVMEEQRTVFNGDMKKPITFDDFANMTYLQSCVKETLRMHPPLILLMRMAMRDIDTARSDGKKFTIPKGDIVVTSPAAAGRMASVFTNPDKFEPERFARDEDKKAFAFLGFGGGRHACMGQQFGMLQVTTLVSVLLRNYDIEPVDTAFPEPDYTAMVVGPKNHLRVRYTKSAHSYI